MTICPIALCVTCLKCPVLSICPAKRILGDIESVQQIKPKAGKKTWPTK